MHTKICQRIWSLKNTVWFFSKEAAAFPVWSSSVSSLSPVSYPLLIYSLLSTLKIHKTPMESPKALEERTLLPGCYGLRQLTASLRLLFPWTVCILLCQSGCSLLPQPPTPTFSTFFPRTKTGWRQRSEEMKTQIYPIPIFVIITVIILVKLILLTCLTRCWSVCNFFFQFRTKLDTDSTEEFWTLERYRVLAEEIHTQPWSWWNGQCPWEFISGGYSWNYLKARGFQDEAALFITEIKIKEIKR